MPAATVSDALIKLSEVEGRPVAWYWVVGMHPDDKQWRPLYCTRYELQGKQWLTSILGATLKNEQFVNDELDIYEDFGLRAQLGQPPVRAKDVRYWMQERPQANGNGPRKAAKRSGGSSTSARGSVAVKTPPAVSKKKPAKGKIKR